MMVTVRNGLAALVIFALLKDISCAKYTGCIGSDCCPGQQEMYPGDSSTLTLKQGGSDSGVWCGHEFIVRKSEESCDGCSFIVSFADFSTPFKPTIELLEANYTQMAFYGPSFQFLSTLATFGGGDEKKAPPASITTTGNILKLSFGSTEGYKGDLTITVKTKTDFNPNEGLYVAIGLGVVCTLIIALVVVCVVVKRRRRLDMARRGEPFLITTVAY